MYNMQGSLGNTKMHLHFTSFFNTDMWSVTEINVQGKQEHSHFTYVNIVTTYAQVTPLARASAAMDIAWRL